MSWQPPQETIDETIDRVAASLTAVPRDNVFQLCHVPSAIWPKPMPGWATVSTAVAILGCLVALQTWIGSNKEATQIVMTAPPVALPADASVSREVRDAGAEAVVTQEVRPTARIVAASSAIDNMAALPAPATLHVEELTLEALTIAPVELDLLHVHTLDAAETGSAGESKE